MNSLHFGHSVIISSMQRLPTPYATGWIQHKTAILVLLLTLFGLTTEVIADQCPRIISQSPYITKSLQWLGLEPCIVGVSRYDTLDRPHTGGVYDPDGKVIESLRPELIFTSNWTKPETLKAVTPEKAGAFRLRGFKSMAQIEENLRVIGNETGIGDIEERIEAFHQQWKTAAKEINGAGKKVLLLSSCSGTPYSFGKERWLSELFTQAGFEVVETAEKIRHIKPGEAITTINTLINELGPELLFIFERTKQPQCALIMPKNPLQIINLDGDKFLHPAPVLFDGLTELKQRQKEWGHP